MHALLRRFHTFVVAIAALGLSAGLVFGSNPPAAPTGLDNASAHAGKTVPVAGGDAVNAGEDEDADEDEDAGDGEDQDVEEAQDGDVAGAEDEETDETTESDDAGDHCTTDPTALTPEELDAMNHGAIVCWAAHQTEWPAWFANHGAFVRCWAHQGKAGAPSCTEDPAAQGATEETTDEAVPTGDGATHGHGHGKGKAKGHAKHLG